MARSRLHRRPSHRCPGHQLRKLYETENVRLLSKYFYEALDHSRAYYVHGTPGAQKTYVLQHLIAELNRSEIAKNGEGRRAYYIYVRQGIRSLDLMKRVATDMICASVCLLRDIPLPLSSAENHIWLWTDSGGQVNEKPTPSCLKGM